MSALPKLILIASKEHAQQHRVETALEKALSVLPRGGVMVIVREKTMPAPALLQHSKDLLALVESHKSKLLVSGRLDLALAANAHGIHLGGEAPPFEQVGSKTPPDFLVGVSLHPGQVLPRLLDGAEKRRASFFPDYALYSPIFRSILKPEVPHIGLKGLEEGCRQHREIPLYALSGVSAENAGECIRAGAHGVAVMSGVLGSRFPEREARGLRRVLESSCG